MTTPDRRPIISGPALLVLEEKHDRTYYLVRDDAELNKAALQILRQRDREGWYPEPELADYTGRDAAETVARFEAATEQFPTWPAWLQEQTRAAYEAAAATVDQWQTRYDDDRRVWESLRRLLALDQDDALSRTNRHGTPLAWVLFTRLSKGEYGGYEIEYPETVED